MKENFVMGNWLFVSNRAVLTHKSNIL